VEKRAQQRIYRINTETMAQLEEWSNQMKQRWSRRLDTLEAVLKAEMRKNAKKTTKQEEPE
jgi:tRNA(Phe) wybutosine-synthesizing methylase Tyw3